MKTILSLVIAIVLAGSGGVAWASGCPALIAQAKAALEQYKKTPGIAAIKDAKIAAVETNIRAAESAHGGGQHDESMQKANEALKLLRQ
jgi:hypothetical protein